MISLDESNSDDYFTMVTVANFFENLGFLTCKGYLARKDALELFGGAALNYWNIFSKLAYYDRYERETKRTDAWLYFEKLALTAAKNKALEIQAPYQDEQSNT